MIRDAPTVEQAIRRVAGDGTSIVSETAVSGGCVSGGRRVDTSTGESFFVKTGSALPSRMFSCEAAGLEALRLAGGPRVPRVAAVWAGPDASFIVMEWIEQGARGRRFARDFGVQLATMHRGRHAEQFGFETDNYIGSTPQPNGWIPSWHDFFRERRIGFQARLARDRGVIDASLAQEIDAVLGRLESLIPAPEYPSLLHGDLWGGNYLVDRSGAPVLIDPAVYFGHREADLAMTELFGGFPARFFHAYHEAWPLDSGYSERVPLYNLYHVLNHANMFGGSYVSSARSILRRYR